MAALFQLTPSACLKLMSGPILESPEEPTKAKQAVLFFFISIDFIQIGLHTALIASHSY